MEARHQIHSRQFLYNPTEADWRKALHTIKYLLKTVNEGIRIDPWEDQGDIFTDAGEEKLEEKATTGILVKSGATPLLWSARKQDVTVLSSNKAEYIALGSGCQEGMWICKVLKSLQKPQIPPSTITIEGLPLLPSTQMYKAHTTEASLCERMR